MPDDNRNLIAVVALGLILLFAYQTYSWFFIEPAQVARTRAQAAAAAATPQPQAIHAAALSHPAALGQTARIGDRHPGAGGLAEPHRRAGR